MTKSWLSRGIAALFVLCIALLPLQAHAAGGSCPTGANYINPASPTGSLVTLASLGVSSCYYFAANGSDANDGLSEASGHPQLHAPGMPSYTGSITPSAGVGFIFRGGDTWHFGNSGAAPYVGACSSGKCWNWQWGGSSTSDRIYVGVDPAWYSGGSFARPILNGDNTVTTGVPSSCSAKDFESYNAVFAASSIGHFIWDNFEFTGFCNAGTSVDAGMLALGGTDTTAVHNYVHGYTITTATTDDEYTGIHGSGSSYIGDLTNQCLFNVFDNSDGSYGTSSTQATMESVQTNCTVLAYNVFNHVSNGEVGPITQMHDNLEMNMFDPDQIGIGPHGNIWNVDNDGLTNIGLQLNYNNIQYNINEGVSIWFMPTTVGYDFNNVRWLNANSTNCVMMGGSAQGSGLPTTTMYYLNDTFVGPCNIRALNNSSDPLWHGTAYFENDQFIGYGTPGTLPNVHSADSGTTPTWTDNGAELFQSSATATAQGYTAANQYAPTSGGSSILAGNNLTSTCSTIPALCSGIGSVSEASGSGGKIAVYPANTVNARSSGVWDVGAYQYGVSPPQNLNVAESGVGYGTITSSPSGISCPPTCTASFTYDANVTLISSTTGGTYLGEWTGDCNAGSPITGITPCVVTMDSAESVTAVFGNSNTAPASYPITASLCSGIPCNTSTAVIQPNTWTLGGTLAPTANCQLNVFGNTHCRLTDAGWDAGPGNAGGPPGYYITSLTESGTTVTVVLSATPTYSVTCGTGLTNCWNITAPSAYSGFSALTTISGSGTIYTYTAATSGLSPCTSGGDPATSICGLAAQIPTSSNSYWPMSNSDWNDFSCGDNFLAFTNNGGEAHIMGLYQYAPQQFVGVHLYNLNASYIKYNGLRFAANGDFSRNCVATPNIYYYPSGSSLMSADLSSSLPTGSTSFTGPYSGNNASGSPVSNTVYNFVAGSTGPWGTTSSNGLPASCTSPNWTDYALASKNPPDGIIGVNFGCQQTTAAGGITIDVAVGSNVFAIDSSSSLTSLNTDGTDDMAPIDTGGTTNAFQFAILCVKGETSPINCAGGGGSTGTGGLLTQNWSLPGSSDCVLISGSNYKCPSVMHGGQDNAFITCLLVSINVLTYAPIAPSVACMNWGTGYVTADAGTGILSGATTLVPGGGYTTNGIYLHGSRVTLGANYVDGSALQPVPGAPASATNNIGLMWNLAATTLAEEIVPGCAQFPPGCNGTGHKAEGFTHMYNPSTSNFPELVMRAYGTNMASYTAGPGGGCTPFTCFYVTNSTGPFTTPTGFDWHTATANDDTADTVPVAYASINYGANATAPGSYTIPGENEIDFVTPSSTESGTWYRAGHTQVCGTQSTIQQIDSIILAGDGSMVASASDGCTAASPTVGTFGCPDLSNDCTSGGQRGDVDVIVMSTTAPAQPVSPTNLLILIGGNLF
jgi:hypothetical protein